MNIAQRLRLPLALVVCGATLLAQQGRSFERFVGKWIGNDKLNEPAINSGMVAPGTVLTISRDENALVIVRGAGARATTIAYPLDGAVADVRWNGKPGKAKLSWEADVMVLNTGLATDAAQQQTERLEVEADHLTMTVRTVTPTGRTLEFKIYLDRGHLDG